VEIQAPIFVFREWHRHRTQSYNEMSGRYTPLPNLNYVPTLERLMLNSSPGNKQSGTIKGAAELTEYAAEEWQLRIMDAYEKQETLYREALSIGVPKELARIHVGVGRYSRMRANANLRNWLHFLTLRMSKKAQWEIRQYADEVGKIVSELFPKTWSLFNASLKE
jgi:thymidylate synthase (FAD)